MKKCARCHETKDLIDFRVDKNTQDGITSYCKTCKQQYGREWSKKNQKKKRELGREWRKKNQKKILEYGRKWYKKNQKKLQELGRKWYKKNQKKIQVGQTILRRNKRRNNLQYRLACNLRARLWAAMRNIKKNKPTKEFLGCSMEDLKAHLENQFSTGMSWDNYGKWHLDHIKPCCSFDLTDIEQQKVCFHYTNLQPLWAIDNKKKGRKIL